MKPTESFYLQDDNIYAVPITHYSMEMAAQVNLAFHAIKPDCIAVELAETMQLQLLHAASRLPDISIVMTFNKKNEGIYYLSEPCEPTFEALRLSLENHIPAHCIDLDVDYYPEMQDRVPDPYAIQRIGLKHYYELYQKGRTTPTLIDKEREQYMGKRLKELSFSYEKILFVGGIAHIERVLKQKNLSSFPEFSHANREIVEICTLTEKSCREVMAESAWITTHYENSRHGSPPDRQKLIYDLYRTAAINYTKRSGNSFPGYNFRNIMKYVRNYALLYDQLMPDQYQILSAAKGCVDHNYAYEVWELLTTYPHLKNLDNLPEKELTINEVWGHSRFIYFHLKHPGRKNTLFGRRRKDRTNFRFDPPGPFSICSYPPEDLVIENFGNYLQKKGTQILTEEGARTVPFSTSLEDGIDTRETIRHWVEKKIYVKVKGKPPGGAGSIVVIFDEDSPEEGESSFVEKYPWRTTWLGEHQQESDMAFYATPMGSDIVGPGISRCEYGGFMMSYPPRRMMDIWSDPDYFECRNKPEVLVVAAIDYAFKPLIVYVSSKPPRQKIKNFASRYGKKVVYLPIGQLSPVTMNKIRSFHVLDSHDKRNIADEYIF